MRKNETPQNYEKLTIHPIIIQNSKSIQKNTVRFIHKNKNTFAKLTVSRAIFSSRANRHARRALASAGDCSGIERKLPTELRAT